jgi:CheY-like chemotaxis protein
MATTKPKGMIHILIADPHEQSRHVIAIMLHKLGYPNVSEAADRAAAEKGVAPFISANSGMSGLLGGAAPKEKCDLDLLILDHDLDGGAGLDYLAALRLRFKPDQLAILFIAAKDKAGSFPVAVAGGANDTLSKPFPLDGLRVKVEGLAGVERPPVIRSFSLGGDAPAAAAPPRPTPKKTTGAMSPTEHAEAALRKAAQVAQSTGLPDPATFAHTIEKYKAKMVGDVVVEEPSPSDGKRPGDRVAIVSASKKETAYSTDGPVTVRLPDGIINGHFHEKVNVIGGGQNCYWARQIGEDQVQLEILSQKGTTTGMVAKSVGLERFMYTFYLCGDHNCPIIGRLAPK